jgi:hypothetical protein
MRRQDFITIIISLILLFSPSSSLGKTEDGSSPRVFLLNPKSLAAAKERVRQQDPSLSLAIAKLKRDADKALNLGPFSVTTKDATPPSGDKHDYMSQAPYFWPDPAQAKGLPYIRRDGERNPEIDKINNHRVKDQMEDSVETLALGYYFWRKKTTLQKQPSCFAPSFSFPPPA